MTNNNFNNIYLYNIFDPKCSQSIVKPFTRQIVHSNHLIQYFIDCVNSL